MFANKTVYVWVVTAWVLMLHDTLHAAMPAAELATEILNDAGVERGLIVHVGCGNGTLTAALRRNEGCLVHGLTTDGEVVARTREFLQRQGIHGTVAVDSFDGPRLPYADGTVNLLVSEDLKQVSMVEVRRVLSPRGVAYLKRDGEWRQIVKPWPETIDDWSHYLHDPGNNAVAHDQEVGVPRSLQWVGSPRWARHHDRMASMSALVSSRGRMFYILDEGTTASVMLPSCWKLVARDAFPTPRRLEAGPSPGRKRCRFWCEAWQRRGMSSSSSVPKTSWMNPRR